MKKLLKLEFLKLKKNKLWSSNMYQCNCCLWAICVAVIDNPNIPGFLNVNSFFPLPKSLVWDVIITSLSPVPGDGCHVYAQLANNLDGKKMPFKVITSWGSPQNSVSYWAHMSLQSVFVWDTCTLYMLYLSQAVAGSYCAIQYSWF